MFLERQTQLDLLKKAFDAATQGEGRLVFVAGEAGAGKTTLIQHFLAMLSGSSRVLIGTCDPVSAPSALGPFYDVARDAGGNFAALLDAGAPRPQLTAALMDLLSSGSRPTILVLEDVHWADEATFDLIRFMGRRANDTHSLVIITYRDDHSTPGNMLRNTLGDLATAHAVSRISLPPLSLEAVSLLVSRTPMDAVAVHQITGGNPFFVQEALASHGMMPATVFDAVNARASRLTLQARAILDLAAVLGPEISLDLLARAAQRDITDDVEQFAAVGLVHLSPSGIVFRHELSRQAILEAIPPMRAPIVHRRALNALMLASQNPDPLRVAYHAHIAKDRDALLAFAPLAADRLASQGRHREASAQCRNALEFVPAEDLELRHSIQLRAANALYDLGDYRAASDALGELVALARETGDLEREADYLQWQARSSDYSGRPVDSASLYAAALALMPQLAPSAALGRLLAAQARDYLMNARNKEAFDCFSKALDLATRLGDIATSAYVLNLRGTTLMYWGSENEGEAELLESIRLAEQIGSSNLIAHARANLGSALLDHQRLAEGISYLEAGKSLSNDRGLAGWRDYCIAYLALAKLDLGRWPEARAELSLLPDMPSGCVATTIRGLGALGTLNARSGVDEVWPYLDRALALAIAQGNDSDIAFVHAARAEALWLAGDMAAAASEACQGLTSLGGLSTPLSFQLQYWLRRSGREAPAPAIDRQDPYSLLRLGKWLEAAEIWDHLEKPYAAAMARSESADLMELEAALRAFDELGARPMVTRVTQLLREMGVRSVPRGPRRSTRQHALGLTAREAEILALLVAGKTNPEIAETLFLSPKTVEHHVSAILAKTGARSRRQVAELASNQASLATI